MAHQKSARIDLLNAFVSETLRSEMELIEKSPLYPNSYGTWAGNRTGSAPDYGRCCEGVWSKERWPRQYQCTRKRGHGPDGAYCKLHDPEAAKARQKASDARWAEKWNKDRYQFYGRTFFDALLKIAEGHNDARGLAQEIIADFKAGERKVVG